MSNQVLELVRGVLPGMALDELLVVHGHVSALIEQKGGAVSVGKSGALPSLAGTAVSASPKKKPGYWIKIAKMPGEPVQLEAGKKDGWAFPGDFKSLRDLDGLPICTFIVVGWSDATSTPEKGERQYALMQKVGGMNNSRIFVVDAKGATQTKDFAGFTTLRVGFDAVVADMSGL